MARLARVVVPGHPHHVTQWGSPGDRIRNRLGVKYPVPGTSNLHPLPGRDLRYGQRLGAPGIFLSKRQSEVGSRRSLAVIVGARRAFLKGGSPCCDLEGVTGELLRRAGMEVVRVP